MKYLVIPKNLNLEKLINRKLPKYNGNKSGINKQNLAYICHSIISQWQVYKDDYHNRNHRGHYVQLKAQFLKSIVPSYKNCIEFLIANNIIECDGLYSKGSKCFSYTINQNYVGKGYEYIKIEGKLKGKLDAYYLRKEEEQVPAMGLIIKNRKHLENTINSQFFTIEPLASRAVLKNYIQKRREARKSNNRQMGIDAKIQLDINRNLINQINGKSNRMINDVSGHRLHTPITRLPKYLRKHLRYNKEKIVAIDVKNSQPYFSLLLFNREFYKGREEISLYKIDKELYKLLKVYRRHAKGSTPIMMLKPLEVLDNTEFSDLEKYKIDVVSGQFYDNFLNLSKDNENYKAKRNEIKERVLTVIYDIPRYNGFAKTLIDKYPIPFKVFNLIKSVKTQKYKRRYHGGNHQYNALKKRPFMLDKGYTKLATLLQRIESHILLDIVCAKIAKENPKIPLITIHDCIATVSQYVGYVENEIKIILTEIIGTPPMLEIEEWQ